MTLIVADGRPIVPASGAVLFTEWSPAFIKTLSAEAQIATLMPSTFGKSYFEYRPSGGTTLNPGAMPNIAWGGAGGIPTSITHPAPSAGTFQNSFVRTAGVSGTPVDQTFGLFSNTRNTLWRGNAAGMGGFLVKARWCRRTSPTLSRGGFGLLNAFGLAGTGIPAFEPTWARSSIFVGYDSTDDVTTSPNYWLSSHSGTDSSNPALRTRVELTGMPRLGSIVYETWFYCAPNSDRIHVLVLSYADEDIANPTVVFDGVVTSNLPNAALFLFIELNASPGPDPVGTGQSAQQMDIHWVCGWAA